MSGEAKFEIYELISKQDNPYDNQDFEKFPDNLDRRWCLSQQCPWYYGKQTCFKRMVSQFSKNV